MLKPKRTLLKLKALRAHNENRRPPLRRDLIQKARAVARWALMGRRCDELARWFPNRYNGRTYAGVASASY